jgi:hypothetical protein
MIIITALLRFFWSNEYSLVVLILPLPVAVAAILSDFSPFCLLPDLGQ